MTIVKEYYHEQIDMRGPGAMNARPANLGAVCQLRRDDGRNLTTGDLGQIFNAISRDFPAATPQAVTISPAVVALYATPTPEYKRIQPLIIGARG